MVSKIEKEILKKVRSIDKNYSLTDILEYTKRAGFLLEDLTKMSGKEIIKIIERELNKAYKIRSL